MLQEQPRQTLRQIVAEHGAGICRDSERVESLLREAHPQCLREVFVLALAMAENIPADLLGTSDEHAYESLEARLTRRLFDRYGIDAEVAAWAVESWALALKVLHDRPPLPPSPPRTRKRSSVSFGKKDQPFSIGDWTILFPADDTDVYVWYGDSAQSAIEIVGSSNGWWHWRHNGTEYVVWSDGTISEQAFFERPWVTRLPAAPAIPAANGSHFAVEDAEGRTSFRVANGELIITLTDGGVITVPGMSSDLKFHTDSNRTVHLPQAVFNDQQNQLFRLGDWFVFWPGGDIDLYLWHGDDAATAIELIGDSNGWWRYRHDGGEFVVYSNAVTARQEFKRTPWKTMNMQSAIEVPSDFELQVEGLHGKTTLVLDGGQLVLRLTDGTELTLTPDTSEILLHATNGRAVRLPDALDEPAPDIPRDCVYRLGEWRLVWPADGNDVYLWHGEDAGAAVEVIGDSNGWWRYRQSDHEYVVWSSGGTSPQGFYEQPWGELAAEVPVDAARDFNFMLPGSQGVTTFMLNDRRLVITLTDHGIISVSLDSPRVDFTSPRTGAKVAFPTDLGRPVETDADAVDLDSAESASDSDAWDVESTARPTNRRANDNAAIALDTTYQFGQWRFVWPSDDNDLYLWHDREGRFAVEVIGDSNGWWRWRNNGTEHVVWSSGQTSNQDFFERPWTNESAECPVQVADDFSFTVDGSHGSTTFAFAHGELRITLTDGGQIRVRANDAQIDFHSPSGAAPVKMPPTLPPVEHTSRSKSNNRLDDVRTDVVYGIGHWRLVWQGRSNNLYLWFGHESPAAVEIIGDSNGWWRQRTGGQEHVVWSDGSTSQQEFYDHPWGPLADRFPTPVPLPMDSQFEVFGDNGATIFECRDDALHVRLTDGGRIWMPLNFPVISFHSNLTDRTFVFADTPTQPPAERLAGASPTTDTAPRGLQAGQPVRVGRWTIFQPTQTTDAYVWFGDDAGSVLELIGNSTGWWNYRFAGREHRVWSMGKLDPHTFFDRPWERALPAAVPLEAPHEWHLSGQTGDTRIVADATGIRITLANGGQIMLDTDSRRILFGPAGSSQSIALPAALVPWEKNQIYRAGRWSMLWPGGDNDFYLWFDTGSELAVELVGHSAGWWRYGHRGHEFVIGEDGHVAREGFYARPWESLGRVWSQQIGDGVSVMVPGDVGDTQVDVGATHIAITLANGNRLELPLHEPRIDFFGAGPAATAHGPQSFPPL